jgi:alcohol dehydrogenase (cytochrome c)
MAMWVPKANSESSEEGMMLKHLLLASVASVALTVAAYAQDSSSNSDPQADAAGATSGASDENLGGATTENEPTTNDAEAGAETDYGAGAEPTQAQDTAPTDNGADAGASSEESSAASDQSSEAFDAADVGETKQTASTMESYQPITAQQLLKPDDGDWPMYRRTYNGQGYSPLDEIDTANVKSLRPVWTLSTGVVGGHEAPPVVVNGVMFVATPGNQVIAVDAKTGDVYWRFVEKVPDATNPSHPTSRGVAVLGDKVFYAGHDARLIALDAKTGNVVWVSTVGDVDAAYYMTLAPLVADNKVMVGVSGGEFGIRGYVAAFDADTGKEAWRTYTVPAPGEPGSETWPDNDAYKTGGGSTWLTGNYDPETKLVYWGVGNGGPWMGDQRPGDNLYTTSVIAMDVATGDIKGYHQYHWNDSFDWDEVDPPLLLDFERDGKTVKGLIHPARDGILWWLERTPEGQINFIDGKPYVYNTWLKSMDPQTGRVDYKEGVKPATGVTGTFCPSFWGGKDWPPAAYSPDTHMIYIPVNDNLCSSITGAEVEYEPGESFTGIEDLELIAQEGADHIGAVQAWNVDTGEKVWEHPFPKSANWGPILATGGGLLFSGGTNDRMFRAYDAETGDVLWEQKLNSGVIGVPVSYEVDGKQYIAVQAGWGIDSAGMQSMLSSQIGIDPEVPPGGDVWVFALDDDSATTASAQ